MKSVIEPKTLPGFMELLPEDQIIFNELRDKIKQNYELFGYTPLDTPVIEDAKILLAKSGGETESQIYSFTKGSNDLALRFDLTVPLAKYVSLYFNELNFPFKRYQIGKVYRGEKPQKGRFREFYQCDIDVIGNGKLDFRYDAEIVAAIYTVFSSLNIGGFLIKINNRKVLSGFLNNLQLKGPSKEVFRIVDKIDKIGLDATKESLSKLGMNERNIEKFLKFILIKGSPSKVLENLRALKLDNDVFNEGLSELSSVAEYVEDLKVPGKNWTIDLSIARGLDYYTGTVYETVLTDNLDIGSVCGGGRYDNLAEYYTKQRLPGVGVSIGLTRLFYKLKEAKLVEGFKKSPTTVLILPMDGYYKNSFSIATELRNANIATEVYFERDVALKKKLNYANNLGVSWVVIIGENEIKSNKISLKNMASGDQKLLLLEKAIKLILTRS